MPLFNLSLLCVIPHSLHPSPNPLYTFNHSVPYFVSGSFSKLMISRYAAVQGESLNAAAAQRRESRHHHYSDTDSSSPPASAHTPFTTPNASSPSTLFSQSQDYILLRKESWRDMKRMRLISLGDLECWNQRVVTDKKPEKKSKRSSSNAATLSKDSYTNGEIVMDLERLWMEVDSGQAAPESEMRQSRTNECSDPIKIKTTGGIQSLIKRLKPTLCLDTWKNQWKNILKSNEFAVGIEFMDDGTCHTTEEPQLSSTRTFTTTTTGTSPHTPATSSPAKNVRRKNKAKNTRDSTRQYLFRTENYRDVVEMALLINVLGRTSQNIDFNFDINTHVARMLLDEQHIAEANLDAASSPTNSEHSETILQIDNALRNTKHHHAQNALLYLRKSIHTILRHRSEIKLYKNLIEQQITKRMRQIEQEGKQWMRSAEYSHTYSFLELTLILSSKLLEQNDHTLHFLIHHAEQCYNSPQAVPLLKTFRHQLPDQIMSEKNYRQTQQDISDLGESIRECAQNLCVRIYSFASKVKSDIQQKKNSLTKRMRSLQKQFESVLEEEMNWLKKDSHVGLSSLHSAQRRRDEMGTSPHSPPPHFDSSSIHFDTSSSSMLNDPTPIHLKIHKQRIMNFIKQIDTQLAMLERKLHILHSDFEIFSFDKCENVSRYIEPQYHLFCLEEEQLAQLLEKKVALDESHRQSLVSLQTQYLQRIFLIFDSMQHIRTKLCASLTEQKKSHQSRLKDKKILAKELQSCRAELNKQGLSQEQELLQTRYIELCTVRQEIIQKRLSCAERYVALLEHQLSILSERFLEQRLSMLWEIQKALENEKSQATSLTVVSSCTVYESNVQDGDIATTILRRIDVDEEIVASRDDIDKLKSTLKEMRSGQGEHAVFSDSLLSRTLSIDAIDAEKEDLMQDIVLQKLSKEWLRSKNSASSCLEQFLNDISRGFSHNFSTGSPPSGSPKHVKSSSSSQFYTIENAQMVVQQIADLLCGLYPEVREHVEFNQLVEMVENAIFSKRFVYIRALELVENDTEDARFNDHCELHEEAILNSVLGEELRQRLNLRQSNEDEFLEGSSEDHSLSSSTQQRTIPHSSFVSLVQENFASVIETFNNLRSHQSPTRKLRAITLACKEIMNSLTQMENEADNSKGGVGADEFLPMLIAIVCVARTPDLLTELHFVERFGSEDLLMAEHGYFFTSLSSAMQWIQHYSPSSL
eukprot:CAMPEP_0117437252 /NCGR_PEP_ID=MMETSP0759-20121206/1428_1 /TAXON_ID=63605 /ORGANISM="Percolomonas cosmopolitus, Strain WS" /LENGTH=1206 /DNA_ID=CAMNT_0005228879 /DNA_START=292 /DNA_END=3912 /DNA_ORIENTATION=+